MKNEAFKALFDVQDFEKGSVEEFTLKNPKEVNPRRVLINFCLSLFCNLISIITASSLLYYYLGEKKVTVLVVIMWVLGLVVLVILEIAKRYTYSHIARKWVSLKKVAVGSLILGLFLAGNSLGISYKGGIHLPDLLSTTPPRDVNPEIDSLSKQLAVIDAQIAGHQENKEGTRIAWNSEGAIKDLTAQRGPIQDRLMLLKGKDDDGHDDAIEEQKEKNKERGLILALLALLSEVGLILLLFRNKSLRYEVARIIANEKKIQIAGADITMGAQKKKNGTGNSPDPQKKNGTGIPDPQAQDPNKQGTDPQAQASRNGILKNKTQQQIGFFPTRKKAQGHDDTQEQVKMAQQPDPQGTGPQAQIPDTSKSGVNAHGKQDTAVSKGAQDTEDGKPIPTTEEMEVNYQNAKFKRDTETSLAQEQILVKSDDYKSLAQVKLATLKKRLKQYHGRWMDHRKKADQLAHEKKQVSVRTQNAIQNNQRWVIIYKLKLKEHGLADNEISSILMPKE